MWRFSTACTVVQAAARRAIAVAVLGRLRAEHAQQTRAAVNIQYAVRILAAVLHAERRR